MRPSSPLLDSVRDQFEDYDQLAKDFTRVFLNEEPMCLQNAHLFDVVFLVGQSKQKARFIGVRAILGVRSRVFQVYKYPEIYFARNTNKKRILGNVIWYTNWFRFATNTCSGNFCQTCTFLGFTTKSKTKKQQLSNSS